jgi:hypothetical protein
MEAGESRKANYTPLRWRSEGNRCRVTQLFGRVGVVGCVLGVVLG